MEDRFCEECGCELAEYEYNGKAYCHECLLDKLEDDKKIDLTYKDAVIDKQAKGKREC